MKKVLILGKGRIGKAIEYYFKKMNLHLKVGFFSKKSDVKNSSLLIGALPGEVGKISLKLALKFKKDLIDVSDVDYTFYLKRKKEIEERGISVFPGCGFSPGLVNLICGKGVRKNKVKEIEIKAGTLSPEKNFFPFLWCLKDLIESHQVKATLVKKGKKIKVAPFSDYRKERIENITAESYLAEGLESLVENLKVKNMSYRILRPLGFLNFFSYLDSYGFFKKENLNFTKKVLEGKKEDNITLAKVKIKTKDKETIWKIKSFSRKNDKLNSMQRITAVFPAVLTKILFKKGFTEKGLFFPEELGKDKDLFEEILKGVKKEISIRRN